jgi:hypothetical protein
MDRHEEKFENYLRGFQPRRPRALAFPQTGAPAWIRRLAAASIVAIAITSSILFLSRRPGSMRVEVVAKKQNGPSPEEFETNNLSLVPLTRLALEDSARLDLALTNASRNVLPDPRRNDSALRSLAKE